MRKYQTTLEFTPGKTLHLYSAEETRELIETWLSIYGRNRQGVNSKDYIWHIFSGGRYPCTEGIEAEKEYAAQQSAKFILLSNDRTNAILTDQKPDWCNHLDAYVFPPNMAWTMALTHEAGWLGPYFARHRDYERLNRDNLTAIKKQQEIELAKQKGWA